MRFCVVDYTDQDGFNVPEGERGIVISPPGALTADMKGLAIHPEGSDIGQLLGNGDQMSDIAIGAGVKSAWLTATGVNINAASNLEEAMYITYYAQADYEDNARLNPLDVDRNGRLKFSLHGRSTRGKHPLAPALRVATIAHIKKRIKRVLESDVSIDRIKTRKLLWHILRKLDVPLGRWRDFVRALDLSALGDGPVAHSTIWTEDYTGQTDGDELSAAPNWTRLYASDETQGVLEFDNSPTDRLALVGLNPTTNSGTLIYEWDDLVNILPDARITWTETLPTVGGQIHYRILRCPNKASTTPFGYSFINWGPFNFYRLLRDNTILDSTGGQILYASGESYFEIIGSNLEAKNENGPLLSATDTTYSDAGGFIWKESIANAQNAQNDWYATSLIVEDFLPVRTGSQTGVRVGVHI